MIVEPTCKVEFDTKTDANQIPVATGICFWDPLGHLSGMKIKSQEPMGCGLGPIWAPEWHEKSNPVLLLDPLGTRMA